MRAKSVDHLLHNNRGPMSRTRRRWVLIGLGLFMLQMASGGELQSQEQSGSGSSLEGSYATCEEAWGYGETLVLARGRFRHYEVTDVSDSIGQAGTYREVGSRLVLVSDSGPAEPRKVTVPGPQPFDSLVFVIDHVGPVPVLWRSEKARAAFKATGKLNKFGLLVRIGDPGGDVEHPYCRDRFGSPFAADGGSTGQPRFIRRPRRVPANMEVPLTR